MKRLCAITTLLATILLMAQPSWAISYGEPDTEHNNVGSFVVLDPNPDTGAIERFQTCTGTLIAPSVVVFASHCYSGRYQPYFTLDAVIDADRDGLVDPTVKLFSGTPIRNPNYPGKGGNTYDVAVFLLDTPIHNVTPARLPPADFLNDRSVQSQTFVAVGYGVVRETNHKAWQAFGEGWRREAATQHFLSLNKAWVNFSMNLATGDGGTCSGDSGGPHFLGDVVVSVTVTGDSPCKALDKTYRLDTSYARDFLSGYVSLP
jgi:Trypsin